MQKRIVVWAQHTVALGLEAMAAEQFECIRITDGCPLRTVAKLGCDAFVVDLTTALESFTEFCKVRNHRVAVLVICSSSISQEAIDHLKSDGTLNFCRLPKTQADEEVFIKGLTMVAGRWAFHDSAVVRPLELMNTRGATSSLLPREKEVMIRVARGQSNKDMAFDLKISPDTIKAHRQSMLKKMGFHNAADVARYVMSIKPEPLEQIHLASLRAAS